MRVVTVSNRVGYRISCSTFTNESCHIAVHLQQQIIVMVDDRYDFEVMLCRDTVCFDYLCEYTNNNCRNNI